MQAKLVASPREETGKQAMKRLRRGGRIPAVLYGHEFKTIPVSLDERSFRVLLRKGKGLHGLLNLEVEGMEDGNYTVVIKEVQRHPLKDEILHVDLQRIRSGEEIQAEVSLHFTGEPVGVKAGGILQHYLYEITVTCIPRNLPEVIEVDVSNLDLRENLRVRDLQRIEGVSYINNPDEIVVAVTPKRVREEIREAEEFAPEGAAEEGAAGEAPPGEPATSKEPARPPRE